ncbi:signal peptidase I [Nocardioides sp. CER19]|uniref:signal peptidase I n=1 Tax=Nocardioides sp. CER19 TaxID=3038538 RepID=UPI002449DC89|nr:signal peptidase I [Nocardioides sp. CER19]MDH2413245.1 signal peptidase I [Nocardioides sp. CER19]
MSTAGGRPVGRGRGQRGAVLGLVGGTGLVLLLLAMLVAVAALTFSVEVSGHSMEPTLRPGDRLEVGPFGREDVRRFDLVEASEPGRGTRIVKRVIGLPGDQVSIGSEVAAPRVYVRPAGSADVYVVDNPAWHGRFGTDTASCCTADGKAAMARAWVTVPPASYWLIGDNWGGSTDSRVFGFVAAEAIETALTFRILPAGRFGPLTSDARLVLQPP